MVSGPADIERKQPLNGYGVTILVDSEASGHYVDDVIIPELKHHLQDYTSLSTARTILTDGIALLDVIAWDVLQGLNANEYGDQQLSRIAILNVHDIGRTLFFL